MIKIFSHYLHRRTLVQVFFDLGLVVATVVLSIMWQVKDVATGLSVAVTCAFLLASLLVPSPRSLEKGCRMLSSTIS